MKTILIIETKWESAKVLEALQPGDELLTRHGSACRLLSSLGSGGQGEVWLVEHRGSNAAAKWYFEQTATPQQRAALERLVADSSPGEAFLWPEEILNHPERHGFGYLMRLRPPNYIGVVDLMAGRISPSFRTIIVACFQIAKAFRLLHGKGFCYCDISFGNIFFNPRSGDVLICDNDNVTVNRSPELTVQGTVNFMAPEIVIGAARPSTATDLYSLAVLIFYMMFMGHPLAGRRMLSVRCWDEPARTLLYGKDPLFIFHPQDHRNSAVPDDEEAGGWPLLYWSIYPTSIRRAFVRAFVEGLTDPHRRVTELEWQQALAAILDSIFYCKCGAANFWDIESKQASSLGDRKCWKCHKGLERPARITFERHSVTVCPGNLIFPHHIAQSRSLDLSNPLAEINSHPSDPTSFGLKNLSSTRLVATMASGDVREVEPGRTLRLSAGVKIKFGGTEARVDHS